MILSGGHNPTTLIMYKKNPHNVITMENKVKRPINNVQIQIAGSPPKYQSRPTKLKNKGESNLTKPNNPINKGPNANRVKKRKGKNDQIEQNTPRPDLTSHETNPN